MPELIETKLIVITADEAYEFIVDAIKEAIRELAPTEPLPALLDTAGISRQLCVGTTTIARLRREGMPCIMLGNSPRFELATCLAWIKSR